MTTTGRLAPSKVTMSDIHHIADIIDIRYAGGSARRGMKLLWRCEDLASSVIRRARRRRPISSNQKTHETGTIKIALLSRVCRHLRIAVVPPLAKPKNLQSARHTAVTQGRFASASSLISRTS
jgi:hypothetical protein